MTNTFLFRFYDDSNNILKEVRGLIEGTKLVISNQFVEEILTSAGLSTNNTKYWDIFLDCNNIFVIIENYNISNQLNLQSFDNTNSAISLFKANDVNLHVVGFKIKQASIDNSEIFLANCDIEELNVDLSNFITFLNDDYTENCIEKFELRNSNVGKLGIYSSAKSLVFSETSVKKIESFSSEKRVLEINNLFVINSSLSSVMMNFKIELLKIQDSEIQTLKFGTKSRIKKLDLQKSTIDYIYGCDYTTIESRDTETWKIIKNSAKCEKNETLYFDASYNIAEIEGHSKNKFVNWFLKESIGFGYKPGRAIRFVIFTIVGFGLLYSLIDLLYYFVNGYRVTDMKEFLWDSLCGVLKRVYFSGITFTTVGYGDITPSNILTKLLAVFEACLGVSLFSLLIYALTKRHLDD